MKTHIIFNSYLLKIGIGQLSTMEAEIDTPVTPLASSRSLRSIDLTILEMDRERRVRRIEERKKSLTQLFMPNHQSKMHCFPPALQSVMQELRITNDDGVSFLLGEAQKEHRHAGFLSRPTVPHAGTAAQSVRTCVNRGQSGCNLCVRNHANTLPNCSSLRPRSSSKFKSRLCCHSKRCKSVNSTLPYMPFW